MTYIVLVLSAIWSLRIIGNVLTFVHLWFIKEYRLDRMLIHLRTSQGKKLYVLPFRRPPISPKTIMVCLGTLLTLGAIVWFWQAQILVALVVCDLISFPVTSFFVFLSSVPTLIYHRYVIAHATNQLRAHKKMTVIGITGSFGKTSTKEFLTAILMSKYKVLKTEASKNSPIGIAEVVLKSLSADTEVFVVEMGAYKRGEIKRMSAMVRPDIGIITAINAQHQDLFGSIETTKKAKYELIQGLKGKKIAILNADNSGTLEMALWAKKDAATVWMYTTEHHAGKTPLIFRASDISETDNGLNFVLTWNGKKQEIRSQVIGSQFAGNITAAIAGSVAAGMQFEEACASARLIRPIEKTMHPIMTKDGIRLIDDTFNNNPDAAKAAINYLAKTSGKKILVFQPMIELGAYASESHKAIGEYAARVCDEIMLTNSEYFDDIASGVALFDPNKKIHVLSPDQAVQYIRRIVQKGDTVLFKGKESNRVLARMQS